jgi:hypothetical protein
MHDTFAGRTLHLRLRHTQRVIRRRLVAAQDRGLNLLDEGSHARLSRDVARGTDFGLTDALSRGCGVRHDLGSVRLCWGGIWVPFTRERRQREAGFLTRQAAQVKRGKTAKVCPPRRRTGQISAPAINPDGAPSPNRGISSQPQCMNFSDHRAPRRVNHATNDPFGGVIAERSIYRQIPRQSHRDRTSVPAYQRCPIYPRPLSAGGTLFRNQPILP